MCKGAQPAVQGPALNAFLQRCEQFIEQLKPTDAAHDLQHIRRVVKTAGALSAAECSAGRACDAWVVLPAAYLHDCVSLPKDHPHRCESSRQAAERALDFLRRINFPEEKLPAIHHAIVAHSFSANIAPETLEAQIVQDADRLDALGAIGVARCIQVGASLGRQFYALSDAFCDHRDADDSTYTLDHFYTKLLWLEDSFQTVSGKVEAAKRTAFMRAYLAQLSDEIQ